MHCHLVLVMRIVLFLIIMDHRYFLHIIPFIAPFQHLFPFTLIIIIIIVSIIQATAGFIQPRDFMVHPWYPAAAMGMGMGRGEPPYPEGVTPPPSRYKTGYGNEPYVITPPWSQIIAYDLNTGKIKWQTPYGDLPEAGPSDKLRGNVFPKSGFVGADP